jgi:endonuclease/exonuclease/phosphatase family metal-dependent hydrolase
VDAYRLLHNDAGYTFPATDPHIRLDYLFTPAPFQGHVRRCEVVNGPHAREASDHLPLLTELTPVL